MAITGFLLSDQYFLDTVATVPKDSFSIPSETRDIIETSKDYERYALTESGVSPRGVPGWGEGLVVVDSDEHTEDGHLTERIDMRVFMMDKRLKKLEGLVADVLPPVRFGIEKAETIFVGWGSTHGAILEAFKKSGRENDSAYLHFKQVYPLPADTKTLFKQAKRKEEKL